MKKQMKILEQYLRPPGRGLYAVSTGKDMADDLLRKIYKTPSDKAIQTRWKKQLKKIVTSNVVLLGCPSDIGASVVRGSNLGPLRLREELYKRKHFRSWIRKEKVLDIGDVFVVPQLLEDEILNRRQIRKNRSALYASRVNRLSVSPLSIVKDVCAIIMHLNPKAKVMLLGGDHSLSWPMVQSTFKHLKRPFGIVHIDAHTDLLKTRLGIDHCFGTWAYHANDLIGRKKRLVQLGIRASSKSRGHWEKTLHVKQFWAGEIRRDPQAAIKRILSHLKTLKLEHIYISNDIDGTGMEYAAATGTPEPKGLSPAFVSRVIKQIGKQHTIIGGDLVEVSPVLHLDQRGEPKKTLNVGCTYIETMIQAMLRDVHV